MRRHIYYTLQSLLHKQGSNAIKIVSLALGLLMSVFLFARIAFELSFDNFYHDSDNLYIVKTGWLKNGVLEGNESRFTIIPIPAAIAEEFPEQVESSTVSCSLFDNAICPDGHISSVLLKAVVYDNHNDTCRDVHQER